MPAFSSSLSMSMIRSAITSRRNSVISVVTQSVIIPIAAIRLLRLPLSASRACCFINFSLFIAYSNV